MTFLLGPSLGPPSPSWADMDGQEGRRDGVGLYKPSSCKSMLLHYEGDRIESRGLVSSSGSAHSIYLYYPMHPSLAGSLKQKFLQT